MCQCLVDEITRELHFVFAYMEKVFLKSKEEHLKHLKIIFKYFNKNRVIMNGQFKKH
jgi:hypothetical protein